MSEPLRIALVAEGPTDRVVIMSALRAILGNRAFIVKQLQPEGSLVFGETGAGWAGVYRWCRQSAARGAGRLGGDALVFQNYDLLILHLDACVAGEEYSYGNISPRLEDGVLPCEQPCPPADATTNALRLVLLTWCGETSWPARVVVCMPSKNMEAWVVAALFPNDMAVKSGIECFPTPETRLAQQPKRLRFRKRTQDYEDRSEKLKEAWPRLVAPGALGEALRFQCEFLTATTR
ncbi:MAG: hypothetical protein FJ388_01845 [Verrucomicrobia bacterium]|nr:hypothetical protein [Verrucomicrobiota bacterium]